MNINNIPENGWPTIPIVGPKDTPKAPKFKTRRVSGTDEEMVDQVIDFYHSTLIPQLACAPDGSLDPHPKKGWIMSSDLPRTIVLCMDDKKIAGAWIIKDFGDDGAAIYYPCAQLDYIALIFRALWDETVKHWDYVWGDTRNPVIMEFAKKAIRVPPTPGSPTISDDLSKLEWRRG